MNIQGLRDLSKAKDRYPRNTFLIFLNLLKRYAYPFRQLNLRQTKAFPYFFDSYSNLFVDFCQFLPNPSWFSCSTGNYSQAKLLLTGFFYAKYHKEK